MKHIKWIQSIHLLRDGELEPEEKNALNIHLKECKSCQNLYEELQLDWVSIVGELSTAPEIPAPAEMTRSILSRIVRSTPRTTPPIGLKRERRLSSLRLGLQLATLVLLAVFLVEQFQVTNSVRSLERQLKARSSYRYQARVSLLPRSVKKRILVNLKNQLEKRDLPARRIASILEHLETGNMQEELKKLDKPSFEMLNWWLSSRSNTVLFGKK